MSQQNDVITVTKVLKTLDVVSIMDTEQHIYNHDNATSASVENKASSSSKNGNSEFYGKAQKYWSEVSPTVNGMLGGLGYINSIDIQGSSTFVRELKLISQQHALDCGAGIGRVSKHLLMPRFETVDLVEQDAAFATKARDYCTLDDGVTRCYAKRLGEIFNVGLQEFTPTTGKYDLIWSQWVLGHLTDADLFSFFIRVKKGLTKQGYFVMKENVTSSNNIDKDEEDSSVTRPLKMYETFLKRAGFKIVRSFRQQNFPKGLYGVYMIACKPKLATV